MHQQFAAAIEKNCLEHISLMGQEQIELEFREELQQLQQMIPMLQNRQAMMQNPNYKIKCKCYNKR